MKTKKIIAVLMALALLLVSFAACTDKKASDEPTTESGTSAQSPEPTSVPVSTDPINVSLLKGPTGIGGAYLWTKSDNGETANTYNITLDTDPGVVGPKLMKGEYDIASIPTNAAASLYQKSGGKVKVIAVNTLGVLYLVTKDNAVTTLDDLKGKTILASGQGQIPEYALNYVLESKGYKIGTDVNIEFTSEHSETVTKALAGGYDVVLLPEPFVTQLQVKDASFSVGINLTEEWEKLGNTTLAMGCIAVNANFYENNKAAVAAFLKDYAESAAYANEHVEEAAKLVESHDIMPAAVAQKAIPNCNIVCLTGDEMKTALTGCYSVLFEQNPKIIGGSMPADDFYVYAEN